MQICGLTSQEKQADDFEEYDLGLSRIYLGYCRGFATCLLILNFLYSIWNGIEIDGSKLNPIPDNRNFMRGLVESNKERDQRTDIELSS